MSFWKRLLGEKSDAQAQQERSKPPIPNSSQPNNEAVRSKPRDFVAAYDLGNALYQKSDFAGAIAQYREAIRIKPDLLEARNNLANTLYSTGDLNAAIAEFRELLKVAPNFADAHNNLGSALFDNDDAEAAIREYREAIRLKPGSNIANIARENLERAALKCEVEQLRAIGRLVTDIRTNHRVKGQYVSLGKTSPFTELEGISQLMDSCANALERGRDEEGNPTKRSDMAGFLQKLSYLTADGQPKWLSYVRVALMPDGGKLLKESLDGLSAVVKSLQMPLDKASEVELNFARRFGGAPAARPKPEVTFDEPAPRRGSDPTEAEFARKCLEPQYREEKEDRKWDSPGAKEVNALLNSKKYEECARAAEAKAAENSDLDLYYDWGGSACLEMNDYARARRILLQGIAKGKRKSLNCSMMGQVEWKARNAKEAVYWWTQAVHCRESVKDYADENPYLYLYYVAEALGLSDVAAALIERVDHIRYSIRLNAAPATDLRDLVRQQATPGMRDVLVGLRERYLKPTPPPTDLSEVEAGLDRALRQIESELKNRPNPAFSMVSLGLEATKYGKKIQWRFKTGGYDAPGTMDGWAAANFLNERLKPTGVTVSRSDMVDSARGNQFFEYDFRSARTQPAEDAREVGRFIEHADGPVVADFISDGKRAVSFGGEESVKVWDLKIFSELGVTSNRHLKSMLGVRPGVNQVLLVYQELFAKPSVVRQWDLDSGNLSDVCQLNTQTIGGLRNAVFSADCRVMLVVGDKKIALWNLTGPTLMSQFEITNRINALALSANNQNVLCAESDNSIVLMNAASGEKTATLVGHEGEVNEVRFTPSGNLALSCSKDCTVRVWDLQSGQEVRCLRGHTSGIRCLDVSADGKYVASGASGYPGDEKDRTIRIWDINTGSEEARFLGHSKVIRSVRFNRSGDLLVSASADKTVRLWKLQ